MQNTPQLNRIKGNTKGKISQKNPYMNADADSPVESYLDFMTINTNLTVYINDAFAAKANVRLLEYLAIPYHPASFLS